MRIEQLRAFATVAEELSFRRAAIRSFVSQPSLSAQIAALERHLGVRLFTRDRSGTALTPQGTALLPSALAALAAVDAVVEAAGALSPRSARHPRLRIGVVHDAVEGWTWPVLEALRAANPGAELTLAPATVASALHLVRDGAVDAVLARGPFDGGGAAVTTLARSPVAALLAAAHPLAEQPSVGLDDVRARPMSEPPASTGPAFRRFWLQDDGTGRRRLTRSVDETDGVSGMLRQLARSGAVGLWPAHLPVPPETGAVLRPLREELTAPLQVLTRRGSAVGADLARLASATVTALRPAADLGWAP